MAPNSALRVVLNLSMIILFAAWICIWILKPTNVWKRSWHVAEDRANATFLGDYGTNLSKQLDAAKVLVSFFNTSISIFSSWCEILTQASM